MLKKILKPVVFSILFFVITIIVLYYIDVENTELVKREVVEYIKENFSMDISIEGDLDFSVGNGVKIEVASLTVNSPTESIVSVKSNGLVLSRSGGEPFSYRLIAKSLEIIPRSGGEKREITDEFIIDMLYSVLAKVNEAAAGGKIYEININEFSVKNTEQSQKYKDLHINAGEGVVRGEACIGTCDQSFSLTAESTKKDTGHDIIALELNGDYKTDGLSLGCKVNGVIDGYQLTYDAAIDIDSNANNQEGASIHIDVKRNSGLLIVTSDILSGESSVNGEYLFQYEDNAEFFSYLQDVTNAWKGNMDFRDYTDGIDLLSAEFILESERFGAAIQTEGVTGQDFLNFIGLLGEAANKKRMNPVFAENIKGEIIWVVDSLRIGDEDAGNLQLIFNGYNHQEFISIDSDDIFSGSLRFTSGYYLDQDTEELLHEISVNFRGVDLANMISSSKGESRYLTKGRLFGFAGMEAEGTESTDVLNSLSGEVLLEVENMEISSKLTSIFTSTLQQTLKDLAKDEHVAQNESAKASTMEVQCGRSLLFVDKGLVKSDNETVLATENTNIFVSGRYSLQSGMLDMGIIPNTKAFLDVSTSSLVKFFRITGPLDNLSISLDSYELLKTGVSTTISYFTGPLGSIAFSYLGDAEGIDIECNRFLE
jgi:hypothetical protein